MTRDCHLLPLAYRSPSGSRGISLHCQSVGELIEPGRPDLTQCCRLTTHYFFDKDETDGKEHSSAISRIGGLITKVSNGSAQFNHAITSGRLSLRTAP